MKKHTHYGSYGLIIEDNNIVLINKVTGPYDGKLDLPGGSIEFKESPKEALIRELKEEIGIDVIEYKLIDADSITYEWTYKNEQYDWQHIGIFYKITKYKGTIKNNITITKQNDDSKGGKFYPIEKIKKEELSALAILILENLGYKLK